MREAIGADTTLKSAGLKPEQDQQFITTWIALHNDEATWSHRSRHQLVRDATRYIQFDRPDVVIAAVREVYWAGADRLQMR